MMLPLSVLEQLRCGTIKPLFSLMSAIDKSVIAHGEINETGIVGDQHAERFHCGVDRALLHYDASHYSMLAKQFPDSQAYFIKGGFGENISTYGINEHDICIGDIVKIGTTVLEVSQPRQPCFKLNYRFQAPTISRYVQDHPATGWFYRVLTAGEMNVGDTLQVIERPYSQWSVAQVLHYLYQDTNNKPMMEALLALPALADEAKVVFQRRLATNTIENWHNRLVGKK